MTLKGQLEHFSLGELFQTLALNQHTGTLVLERDGEEKSIYFSNGVICRLATGGGRGLRLGEILIRDGYIDANDLEEAVKEQKKSGKLLGKILIEHGHLTLEDVQNALRRRVEEELHELFLWEVGTFEFLSQHCPPELLDPLQQHSRIQLDPNGVVMEGLRQQDELGRVRENLPDTRILVRRSATADPGDSVSKVQLGIWELVAELTSVDAVVEASHQTPFNVLTTLNRFLESGWLETLDVPAHLHQAREDREAGNLTRAASIFGYLYDHSPELNADPSFLDEYGKLLLDAKDRHRGHSILREAVQAYHAAQKDEPAWEIGHELYKHGVVELNLLRTLWAVREHGSPKVAKRIRDRLLEALEKEGRLEELAAMLEELETEHAEDGQYWVHRGEINRRLEQSETALRCLERSLELLDETRATQEVIRVLRLIFDLDPSRAYIGKRIQELLAVQKLREEQKRRRFTRVGVPLIVLLAALIYPIHYELSARRLFQQALLVETAYASSPSRDEDDRRKRFEEVLAAFEEISQGFSLSSRANDAHHRSEELREGEDLRRTDFQRLEGERQRRLQEQRRELETSVHKLRLDGEAAVAAGNLQVSRNLLEEYLEGRAKLPHVNFPDVTFPIRINSEPEGARIAIDGNASGVTPFTYRFAPGASFQVSFERHGCLPETIDHQDQGQVSLNTRLKRVPLKEFPPLPGAPDCFLPTPDSLLVSCRDGVVYLIPREKVTAPVRTADKILFGEWGHPGAALQPVSGGFIVSGFNGLVEIFEKDPAKNHYRPRWSHRTDAPIRAHAQLSPDGACTAVGDESGLVTLIDNVSGKVLGTHQGEFPVVLLGLHNGGLAVIDQSRQCTTLSLPQFEVRSSIKLKAEPVAFLPTAGVLLRDGQVGLCQSDPLPAPATRVARRGNELAYVSQDQRWVRIGPQGAESGALRNAAISPPFFRDGRVFYGTRDRRLVCMDPLRGPLFAVNLDSWVLDFTASEDGNVYVMLTNGKLILVEGK